MTVNSVSTPQPPEGSRHARKYWLLALTIVFSILGVIAIAYWFYYGQYFESTDDAYVAGNSVQVMSQIAGQVTQILADDTDLVNKGSVMVELDKANAEIALKKAEAELALTVRQVNQYYVDVTQNQATVQLQTDNLEKSKDDYKRRQGLVINKTISAEELEHARIEMDTAKDALAQAQQKLESSIAMVSNIDLYHHPLIEQASVNYRNAYLNWRRATIYSPVTGYVTKRLVQVGQEVNPNTVLMVIVPLYQVWVEANFKEPQLKNIRIGQKVEMYSDAYGSGTKYTGTVVGLNPGTGSSRELLPPQNATGNWIKIVQRLPVKIAIDKTQLEKNPLQIGLSMTVSIDTHDRKGGTLSKHALDSVIYSSPDFSTDLKEVNNKIQKILKDNAENKQYNKGS